MRDVVIVDFARTAFAARGGALRLLSATQTGARCLQALLKKSGICERGGDAVLSAVFAGCSVASKDAGTPTRYMTQLAGLPLAMEGHFVEMQDASALASVNQAAAQIALGYADVVIAGAMESFSTRPAFMSATTEPYQGLAPAWVVQKQSPFAEQDLPPEEANDRLAAAWDLSREACDDYALESRGRLESALRGGRIGEEIAAIDVPTGSKKLEAPMEKDELPAAFPTRGELGAMAPLLPGGTTTKGNSSVYGDGAGFLLLMTPEKAKELGYVPYARWIIGADAGTEPVKRGIAPAASALKALKRADLGVKDIGVWENSELYAAEDLAVMKALEKQSGTAVDRKLWNAFGGALGLGYPGAATGAQMLMFAVKRLEQSGSRFAAVSAAADGGMAVTVLLENLRS